MATVAIGAEAWGVSGEAWGRGVARCFTLGTLDDHAFLRLLPIPENFLCPISQEVMEEPVATVDGFIYDRRMIEQWLRTARQRRNPITSPMTGRDLSSDVLVPVVALQKAIEAYMAHRPELRELHMERRSFESAASLLQGELLEKQAVKQSVDDEVTRLSVKVQELEEEACQREAVHVVEIQWLRELMQRQDPVAQWQRDLSSTVPAEELRSGQRCGVVSQEKGQNVETNPRSSSPGCCTHLSLARGRVVREPARLRGGRVAPASRCHPGPAQGIPPRPTRSVPRPASEGEMATGASTEGYSHGGSNANARARLAYLFE